MFRHAFEEHFAIWRGCSAMGHDCGPRERAGGFGRGAAGFGRGPGGFGGRGTRMFGPGDLRLVLLDLIAERPRHGYDLMRAIEEKFGGAYAPSPGAVYPTLTLLVEQDYLQSQEAGGGKKLYSITAEGVSYLAQHKDAVEGVKARMDLAAQAFSNHATPAMVRQAFQTLRHALHMRQGPWSQDEAGRVRAILEKAARDILGGSGQA
jgi:DNA-binding PadR family transcriptional regulator